MMQHDEKNTIVHGVGTRPVAVQVHYITASNPGTPGIAARGT